MNQTINLALGIVVIAALVGAEGLGQEVLAGLQHLDVGAGVRRRARDRRGRDRARPADRGPARSRRAAPSGASRTPERAAHRADRRAAALVIVVIVVGKLWSPGTFPTSINFSLHDPVNSVVDWCKRQPAQRRADHRRHRSISDFIVHPPARSDPRLPHQPRRGGRSSCGVTALGVGDGGPAGRRDVCAIALLVVAGLHAEGRQRRASGSTRWTR